MTEGNWVQIYVGISQVAAVILAGILAVWIDRTLEQKREEKKGKLWILKTLMVTRSQGLTAEHINALNLIDYEFYAEADVRQAWKEYLTHLCTVISDPKDEALATQWNVTKQDLLIKLIVKIAAHLGYKYEHFDLKSNTYSPMFWYHAEQDMLAIRKGLREWIERERALPLLVKLLDDDTQPPSSSEA